MALYTRKGDKGDTCFFGSKERISKSSPKAEALGDLDEINSLIGFCRAKCRDSGISGILRQVQEDLFIIQAELGGADKKISQEKTDYLEGVIDSIEKKLPEIKTFFIPGGLELSALLDFARTVARRAERSAVALSEKKGGVRAESLAYLNRLSSLLYALARLANFKSGEKEDSPSYE
jgi:cob(I)alamin adenosyltransferase